MAARKKPKSKPSRRHPNTEFRWSGELGRWRWRARIYSDGAPVVGSWRDTEDHAAEDALKLRRAKRTLPRRITRLQDALVAVQADAEMRDVTPYDDAYVSFWTHYLHADVPLTDISADDLVAVFRLALEDHDSEPSEDGEPEDFPRHGRRTLIEKDFPLLKKAFELQGLLSPVDEAKRRLGKAWYKPKPKRPLFELHELGDLLRRMREETFVDKRGVPKHLDARQWHADLVELFALSGLRSSEIGRIRFDGVDLKRMEFHVDAKVKSESRTYAFPEEWVPLFKRLIAVAKAKHRAGNNKDKQLIPRGMPAMTTIFARWKELLGETRLNGRVLRRSVATGVQALPGVTTLDAKGILGHTSLDTTSRYSIASLERQRASLAKVVAAVRGEEPST